jgi:hypothetical protein
MKRLCSTMAILLLSGGLALAQNAGAGGPGSSMGNGAATGNTGAGTGPTFTPTNPSSGSTVGQAPGANPSNPQDQTNRNNPHDLTKPGGSNPQDLKR